MSGVVEGIFYGQFERTEELNKRISQRNIADRHLENWFTPVPFATKQMRFPMVNCNHTTSCAISSSYEPPKLNVEHPVYNISQEFAPVTRAPPFAGFSTNVDMESNLRNQFYAAQKSNRAVYIPSSNSDLYKVSVYGRDEQQTHPLLFAPQEIGAADGNKHPFVENIGRERFMNHTRTQLRAL